MLIIPFLEKDLTNSAHKIPQSIALHRVKHVLRNYCEFHALRANEIELQHNDQNFPLRKNKTS